MLALRPRSSKKDLEQWFFKITDYADELLKDLDLLEGWPERVKTMQRNWIGRSEGLEFSFDFPEIGERIPVYTTRPDTIYGVTYVVLAAEHPLVEKLCVNNPKAEEIKAFCDRVRNQSDIERTSSESEKEGLFTGCYCIHPLTGKKCRFGLPTMYFMITVPARLWAYLPMMPATGCLRINTALRKLL